MIRFNSAHRSKTIAALTAAGILGTGLIAARPSAAQGLPGEGSIRYNTFNATRDVAWDQKLDNSVAPDLAFRDESGKTETLGQLMTGKPVILVMPFYKCPGICSAELNGMVDAFKDQNIQYKVGRDFDVVTVSINPQEGADIATAKKKEYMDMLMEPGADSGWHFLTGDEASIQKLADEVGFRYKYDAKTDQYAHPSGIVVLTPKGKISRYFFGVAYSPKDLRLALTEAGQGKVGTVADKFVLACYHYDPRSGRYGLAIFRILQVACLATLAVVGTFMGMMFRKDFRDKREQEKNVADLGFSGPARERKAEG